MAYLGEYIEVGWENEPSQRTPVNAYNLGIMEDGIKRLFAYLIAGGGTGPGGGSDGREVELRNNGEYIQWRYSGEEDWVNLVSLADLKGEKGDDYVLTDEDIEEIASKVKVETSAYKITYDDTETQLGATNVQDAIGQLSEQKVNKTGVSLGVHTDGKIYVFVDGKPVGTGVEMGTVETFTITNSLQESTNSNTDTTIAKGSEYTAIIVANEGYVLSNVIVTMGGEDITETVYNDGAIVIPEVTGNIVIIVETSAEVIPTDIMSNFKYLGATTYSPGTYTAWCPTGLIYDETRDVYAHFMNVQNSHYSTPNASELWFNTINPLTLEHSEPVFVSRNAEQLTGNFSGNGALGTCIKDGVYYAFSKPTIGYFVSSDGGVTWSKETYETAPDQNPWGCYVLSNGRMIMGTDTLKHKVYYSDDNGKNWTTVQCTAFNEPTFVDFGNGTVMAICRENMDSSNNIQKPWMHVSYDYGETWTSEVAMETVGYMGNNNCNAYVHDGYCELFVGCRIPTSSPQYTDTLYQINQYVLDLNKGPVDEFEFVNTVYQFKNDDNPQGLVGKATGADDFSTPCIAIRDKSHSLLMFYAPNGKLVTHNLIAVGNVPVDGFEIPKPMPTEFKASQVFTGASESINICETNSATFKSGYPKLDGNTYLILDDIEDGGYFRLRTQFKSYNGWDFPIFVNVKDLTLFAGYRDTMLPDTPMPTGVTSPKGYNCVVFGNYGGEYYPTDGTLADIYARFKDNAWWTFYNGSWIRNYTSDTGIVISEDATGTGWDNGYLVPYTVGGKTTYKAFVMPRNASCVYELEYDKKVS